MKEWMYHLPSLVIVLMLAVFMLLALEVGFRLGRKQHAMLSSSSREQINGIQASLLGILALLLGFTFSLALQRFDSRSAAEVREANTIGTAWLRAHLLPDEFQAHTLGLWRQYIDIRVNSAGVALNEIANRQQLRTQGNDLLAQLWVQGLAVAKISNSPVDTGLYLQALNEAIDAFAERSAELDRHVPELILWLLYVTFVLTGGVVGYAAGAGGHRPPNVSYIMILLIIILNFIVIDLDRPRRGFIKVDQSSMLALQQQITKGLH